MPWLHLFRGLGIALDVRKLLVCLGGLALFLSGSRMTGWTPPAAGEARTTAVVDLPPAAALSSAEFPHLVRWVAENLLLPLRWVLEPAATLLWGDQSGTSSTAAVVLQLLWGLLVWTFIGGILTRLARHDVARGERGGLAEAVQFTRRRYPSLLTAPMLPVLAVVGLMLLSACAGLAGRMPVVGAWLLGAFWFVPLLFGAVQVLVMAGLLVGWPLMIATVSVEDADAFEGFSRAFSYVFSRVGYLVWLVAVALGYGLVLFIVATLFCSAAAEIATRSVAAGLGAERAAELFDPASELAAAQLLQTWSGTVELLLAAFAVSYVWSQVTMIYGLLRLSVDNVPLDDLVEEPARRTSDSLPLVGVAASEAREQQLRQSAGDADSGEPSAVNA